jgi:hypothetical protein
MFWSSCHEQEELAVVLAQPPWLNSGSIDLHSISYSIGTTNYLLTPSKFFKPYKSKLFRIEIVSLVSVTQLLVA